MLCFVLFQAGYQITQQNHAIANDGAFRYIEYGEREEDCIEKSARILQLQLEQDSGKSLHDDLEARSLIDLNRAGIASFVMVYIMKISDLDTL
jgi:aspartyl-tRNA(Asn)/glutamyl-tRNA(Gln) amidotransferase subunit B